MKKLCFLITLVLLSAGLSFSTITVTTTTTSVVAVSGTITCTFTAPNRPTIHTTCSVPGSGVVFTQDSNVLVGATNGAVGSFANGKDMVTWIVQQPTTGSLSYQVTDGIETKSGTF